MKARPRSYVVRGIRWAFLLVLVALHVGTSRVHADPVVNGGFNGTTEWTLFVPGNSSVTCPGQLDVVGASDGGGPQQAWAYQDITVAGGTLHFDLLSYTSSDGDSYDDYPIVHVDGMNLQLFDDGTTDGSLGGAMIGNSNQVAAPIHFTYEMGPGTRTVGFGVYSSFSNETPGTGRFDNVTFDEVQVLAITLNTNDWDIGSMPLNAVTDTHRTLPGFFCVWIEAMAIP